MGIAASDCLPCQLDTVIQEEAVGDAEADNHSCHLETGESVAAIEHLTNKRVAIECQLDMTNP